jgi:hypothetical protein
VPRDTARRNVRLVRIIWRDTNICRRLGCPLTSRIEEMETVTVWRFGGKWMKNSFVFATLALNEFVRKHCISALRLRQYLFITEIEILKKILSYSLTYLLNYLRTYLRTYLFTYLIT